MTVFALHEDDYGMVELFPEENLPVLLNQSNESISKDDQTSHSSGWVELKYVQYPPHALSIRCIPLIRLSDDVRPFFNLADELRTGYGSNLAQDLVSGGFAFGEPYGDSGGLYGLQVDGIVQSLYLSRYLATPTEADLLTMLGQRYNLLLVDWLRDELLLLKDRNATLQALARENDE